jgi:murein DD-endopeptidase MepM/ murein hydrolase activator NlpD
MVVIRFSFVVLMLSCAIACVQPSAQVSTSDSSPTSGGTKSKTIAEAFAYPISKSEVVTQKKDKDDWYNALDFGVNDHLGEDWNKNSGGNTDCGEPVYAAANGIITYADDAGPGWGNVLIVEHTLPSGEKLQTLYGHLLEILKKDGEVKKREQIGKIGNANGRYACHLHFELRSADCPMWNQAGGGYAIERKGWLDPSNFIDSQRQKHDR